MKLSTIKWLSKAIALPLFLTIFSVTAASAEQIDRSRSSDSEIDILPSVTDLNLLVPVNSSPSPAAADLSEPSNSIEPIWVNPARTDSSTRRDRTNKTKLTLRSAKVFATNFNLIPSVTGEQPRQIKTESKRRNSMVPNSDPTARGSYNRQKIAAVSQPPLSGNYLRLVRDPSKGTNDLGNPIYTLEAYVNGTVYQTFSAVTGTAATQNFNRNRGNNRAPLPDGLYGVSDLIVPGQVAEVGRTFIGIFPKFETARTDLGIHLDRSFNKTNGFDGTAGCIGIGTVPDRDAINEFVTKYRPRTLYVRILSPAE